MWTTGPRRHVADLYVDHRTHVGHRTTKACDRPRCGPQDQHMATEHTYMWNTPTGLLHTNTEQDQPCGPLYKDRWTTIYQHTEQDQVMWTTSQQWHVMWTATKQHWTRPGHVDHLTTGTSNVDCNKTWTCGLPYKDMWTTLQLGQVMWTATRPGHVDFLTRTCGPLYPNWRRHQTDINHRTSTCIPTWCVIHICLWTII